jgi:hypothetical protein
VLACGGRGGGGGRERGRLFHCGVPDNLLVAFGEDVGSRSAEREELCHYIQLPNSSINQLQVSRKRERERERGREGWGVTSLLNGGKRKKREEERIGNRPDPPHQRTTDTRAVQ